MGWLKQAGYLIGRLGRMLWLRRAPADQISDPFEPTELLPFSDEAL
jgi:hypothetical protein